MDEIIDINRDRISSDNVEQIDDFQGIEQIKKLEAVLFIAGKFLSIPELVSLTEISPILLKKFLADLEDKYKDSGFVVVRHGDMWKMDVSSEYSFLVSKLAGGKSEFSKAEQESLAIIAYKQPMKQSVLIKIRGNKGYDHIKKFVEMGLILKKKIGHTAELSLSDKFYEYFNVGESGLKEVDDE
jgi:segregation and condensation protein B